jgi:hypothetical protein
LPTETIIWNAREYKVTDQHGCRVTKQRIGGLATTAQRRLINHIVMQQGAV